MAVIFINGLNSKVGGGKSILKNYLTLLNKYSSDSSQFVVLVPDYDEYACFSTDTIKVIRLPIYLDFSVLYPLVYDFYINYLLKLYNVEVVLNFADIPVKTKISQVFLFDWPYAVYPDSIVWRRMDTKSYLTRKLKLWHFKKNLRFIDVLCAQTVAMQNRLQMIYGCESIEIVPNAVSIDNFVPKLDEGFYLPDGIRLLYLTHYYPHKNLEIFIPVAKQIKRQGLDFKIIVTISERQHVNAKKFLYQVRKQGLEDVIVNVGPVPMTNVPRLYKCCHALLMPTLLESFSGTYVEAMFHQLPIFTSDIDFARAVCGEAAMYFDPFDEIQIVELLKLVFSDDSVKEGLILRGNTVLGEQKSWEAVFFSINDIIYQQLVKDKE